jgi:UDP-N-acetylglucosamine--N-acetylmuramyl-(pentapeptide) pyrophosphoryl-undecaprenol N-acetylglucosamine transferase
LDSPIRIEFAGGMTGGHFFPALALAQEFQRRFPSCDIRFWGTKRGIENRLQKSLNFNLKTIPVRGFQRRITFSNLLIPFELLISFMVVLFTFIFRRPNLVVGTGGFVSGPVLFIASRLGIPTAIHEQNSCPGATTRMLSGWVKSVYLTYESSKKYFKNQEKLKIFGNPVRSVKQEKSKNEAIKEFKLNPEKKTLFVFGGSQGGLGINNLMSEIINKIVENKKSQILWATGPNHLESIKNKFGKLEGLHVYPFIDNMYSAYFASDLAVCRAGATTLSELTYLGLPAILIPFPHATAGHQEFNARELEKEKAAKCLIEKNTTGDQLYQEINDLLNDDNKLSDMKTKMKNLARPNAASDIVSDICDHLLSN